MSRIAIPAIESATADIYAQVRKIAGITPKGNIMHVKKMLEKVNYSAAVTQVEARDAMLGCFVTIHGESLKRGAELPGKSLSDTEAENHATV